MSEKQPNKIDMKAKVMEEIKKKKIGINSHSRIMAEKLGVPRFYANEIL